MTTDGQDQPVRGTGALRSATDSTPYGRYEREVIAVLDAEDRDPTDTELSQVARLKAEHYWKRPAAPDWERVATFLLRPGGSFIYAVYPILAGRYYAVVRVHRDDVRPGDAPVLMGAFEYRLGTTLEEAALKLACREVAEDP